MMERRHGFVSLLATWIFLSGFWVSEAAPLRETWKSGKAHVAMLITLFSLFCFCM